MNKEEEKIAAIEAFLFYYGEPVSVRKIAKFLDMKDDEVKSLVEKLASNLSSNEEAGLFILKNEEEVELATKPSLGWISKKLIEEEFKEELTPAALETVAIIAYLQPVTRAVIDYIRGVNSTFILRNLLIRGLATRNLQSGKKNVYEYSVSFDFLKHMGIASVENLPEYQKYKNILKKFENFEPEEVNNNSNGNGEEQQEIS